MASESIANKISNILTQCDSTTISIGHTEGHFLSSKQLSVLQGCVESLRELDLAKAVSAPTFVIDDPSAAAESEIRARRLQVSGELKYTQALQALAAPEDRSKLNLDIGRLLSERAKLDKLIAQFS